MKHWCFVIIALICLGGCMPPKKTDETSTEKPSDEMEIVASNGKAPDMGLDASKGKFSRGTDNNKVPDRVIEKAVEKAVQTNNKAVTTAKTKPVRKNKNMETTDSGLQIETLVEGDGASPQMGDTAVVHYTGWLTNGTQFDSSVDRGTPFTFPVGRGRVIKGWDEGVALMKIGQKVKLTIPPELGYGQRGAGGVIPPNATLIFEVELLEIR